MRKAIVGVLIGATVQVCARGLAANCTSGIRSFVDTLLDNLVDKSHDWALKKSPLHGADLDRTMLGTAGWIQDIVGGIRGAGTRRKGAAAGSREQAMGNNERLPMDERVKEILDVDDVDSASDMINTEEEPHPVMQEIEKEGLSALNKYFIPMDLEDAADAGDVEDVKTFLKIEGSNPNQVNEKGRTPLFAAVQAGHKPVSSELIAAGSNVGVVDKNGNTALHYAVLSGHGTIVELLLNAGASTNVLNANGKSPADVAHMFSRSPIRNDPTLMARLEQDCTKNSSASG